MIWDDATIKRMEKHWANGLSGSQIAKLLGTTRSAVLGKARRMGLPSRLITQPVLKKKIARKTKFVLALKTTAAAVFALRDDLCKYPYGEPGKPNFRFCLKPVARGGVYCPEHKELCLHPRHPRLAGAGKL